jgi:outer membrane protein TolC
MEQREESSKQRAMNQLLKGAALWLAAALASSLLAGCMVGPNYHRPVIQSPTAFRDLSENPQVQAQTASFADLPWWQVFQDAQLQELIRTALKQNYDLQLATERINTARAQLAITRSNLFPQVQGNGNFNGGKEHNFQSTYNFLTLTATRPATPDHARNGCDAAGLRQTHDFARRSRCRHKA